MTTAYGVQVDEAHVADAKSLFEFVGGNSADALRIAINRTTPKARTASSTAIREQVRLQAAYVKERLTIIKATKTTLNGRIRTLSRGLLLSRFSTDPMIAGDKVGWMKPPEIPPLGIRVKVKPDGATKVVSGDSETAGNKPFYIVLNKGANVGIAARLSGSKNIKVFSGPSLSQVFNTVRSDITPEAATILQSELLDAMRYLLVKKYPPEPVDA